MTKFWPVQIESACRRLIKCSSNGGKLSLIE